VLTSGCDLYRTYRLPDRVQKQESVLALLYTPYGRRMSHIGARTVVDTLALHQDARWDLRRRVFHDPSGLYFELPPTFFKL